MNHVPKPIVPTNGIFLSTRKSTISLLAFILCLCSGVSISSCTSNNAPITPIAPTSTNTNGVSSTGAPQLALPATIIEYSKIHLLPTHFLSDNTIRYTEPLDNPVTDAGATLGRVLFYDKKLSLNNSTACATCHKQELAFSDSKRLSDGFLQGATRRHSMNLNNIAYTSVGGRGGAVEQGFFWDNRAATLEIQVLMPIQDKVEMGMTLDSLTKRLAQTDYYKPLFAAAFGTPDVTSDRIAKSLAQFVRSLISYRSKFDVGVQSNFQNFTAQEQRGRAIFTGRDGNCATCHETRTQFIAERPENNGLDAVSTTDLGLAEVTNNPRDAGRFRVPSLRNIELTAPYMHDGRLLTLEDVVEHYNSGVQAHPNLSNQLRANNGQNTPRRLNLSTSDKQALVAFLKTLTDTEFTKDTRFANPFPVPPVR